MSFDKLESARELLHRSSGDPSATPLIYLPGVHGDWTLFEQARPQFSRRFRMIEVAYPRATTWKLEDFAASLDKLLDEFGLRSAHIIGESFGSLVAWTLGLSRPDRVRSFTLVGGFCQPPPLVPTIAKFGLNLLPTNIFEFGIDSYVGLRSRSQKWRSALNSGEIPYPVTRTTQGRLSTVNRLEIIRRTDYRSRLAEIQFPVRYIGGSRDPVVPVHREVRNLAAGLSSECGFQQWIIAGGPHMIFASHPVETSRHITDWVDAIEAKPMAARGN